jgi:hypothetical protein
MLKGTPLRLAILFFCATGTMLILQSAFDASDHGKAERAVRSYTVEGAAGTLGAFVEAKTPGGAWSTEITHGCRGIVSARYAAPSAVYEWDYDVPAHTIHPANEAGRAALESFVGGARRK